LRRCKRGVIIFTSKEPNYEDLSLINRKLIMIRCLINKDFEWNQGTTNTLEKKMNFGALWKLIL